MEPKDCTTCKHNTEDELPCIHCGDMTEDEYSLWEPKEQLNE